MPAWWPPLAGQDRSWNSKLLNNLVFSWRGQRPRHAMVQHAAGLLVVKQRPRFAMHQLKQRLSFFWISVCMLSSFGFVIGTPACAFPANARAPTATRTMAKERISGIPSAR